MVREVVKATGDIITVAGNGTAGYSGDNGPATAAELDDPTRRRLRLRGRPVHRRQRQQRGPRGGQGDRRHHHRRRQRHRRLQRRQWARDRRRAGLPLRVAVDSAGDLFVADTGNNVVREITPAVTVTIGSPVASQVAITSAALTLVAGTRGQMTVQLEDSDGDTGAKSSVSQTISLSTTSGYGAFYATSSSSTPITSVVISAGKGSATFYYADTKTGTPTVTTSDSALSSAPRR